MSITEGEGKVKTSEWSLTQVTLMWPLGEFVGAGSSFVVLDLSVVM